MAVLLEAQLDRALQQSHERPARWQGARPGVRVAYALGLDDQLVGVTFECNEPAAARQTKRIVVGGRDTSALSAGEIDDYVRWRFLEGLDDIGLTLRQADLIGEYEQTRPPFKPTTQIPVG